MNYLSITARRCAAIVVGVVVTGLLAATAAFATTSSGAAPSIHICKASSLGVWLAVGQGNGAVGTIYYPLEFTNLSGHSCSLDGFPGVSAIDGFGNRLGSSANWEHTLPAHRVILAPGRTAHTMLAYHDAAVTTEPGCHPVNTAQLLKVYPPGRRTATYAAYAFQSCSRAGVHYLSIVGPIIPGVGTVNG